MNNTLDTALSKPESGVRPPTLRKSSSFTAQVEDLALGESCAKVEQIHPSLSLNVIQAGITMMRSALRDRVDPSVAAAKKRTGGTYVTEVCDFMTKARSWFVVAIVTRVE